MVFQKLYKETITSPKESVEIIQMEKITYEFNHTSKDVSSCRIYYNEKFISASGCQSSSPSYDIGSNGKLYIIDKEETLLEIE